MADTKQKLNNGVTLEIAEEKDELFDELTVYIKTSSHLVKVHIAAGNLKEVAVDHKTHGTVLFGQVAYLKRR